MTRKKIEQPQDIGPVDTLPTGSKKQAWLQDGSRRIFSVNESCEDLEWHVDFEDREIKVINGGGWKLQYDNSIPKILSDGDSIFIEKYCWHRIIKGQSDLTIDVKIIADT